MKKFFFILLAAMLAGCGTGPRNIIEEIEPDLPRLGAEVPAPAWQTEIEARNIDIMEFLPDNRLLVGTLKVKRGFIVFPLLQPGDLMAMDAETGRILWSIPRTRFASSYRQTLLAVQPNLVIGSYDNNGFKAIYALDSGDGTVVWEEEAPNSYVALLPGSGRCVIASIEQDALDIRVLDISDGSAIWERTLPQLTADRIYDISFIETEESLIVAGSIIKHLSLTDGSIIWKADIEASSPPALSRTLDTLFTAQEDKLSSFDLATGEKLWEWNNPDGSSIISILPESGQLMVISGKVSAGEIKTSVNALSYGRGKQSWRFEVPDSLSSSLLSDSGLVYFSTADRLFTVDAGSGRLVITGNIPPFLQKENLLPDILMPLEKNIVLARENGMAVFSREGDLFYAADAEGGWRYTSGFSSKQFEDFLLAQVEPSARIEYASSQSTTVPLISSNWYDMAKSNQEYVYQRTEYDLKSDSSGIRSSAREQRIQSVQTSRRVGIAQSQAEMGHFIAGLSQAIAEGIIKVAEISAKGFMENTNEWTEYQTEFAGRLHSKSASNRYYIRPVYNDGWRLFIVDLLNRREGAVLLSPSNEALTAAEAHSIFAYAVDEESSRIYASGLGMDFESSNTYLTKHPQTIDNKLVHYTIPYPSVMCFSLDDISWSPVKEKEIPLKQSDPLELELVEASKLGNLEKVRALLGSGVSPDSVDSIGKSALIHAAQNWNTEVVSLLIDSGADIYYEDELGWTAYDYLFYPLVKGKENAHYVQTRNYFVKAHKKNLRSGNTSP